MPRCIDCDIELGEMAWACPLCGRPVGGGTSAGPAAMATAVPKDAARSARRFGHSGRTVSRPVRTPSELPVVVSAQFVGEET